jgi:hypothetical protein
MNCPLERVESILGVDVRVKKGEPKTDSEFRSLNVKINDEEIYIPWNEKK